MRKHLFVSTFLMALMLAANPVLAKKDKTDKEPKLAPPTFSHESGFYPEEFELELSHPDKDVTIYYTLDGSEPDPNNLQGSTYRYKNSYQQPPKKEGEKVVIQDNFLYNEYKTHKYTGPIIIKDRTFEPDRISQISTTFDENPSYFPKPKPADTWKNSAIRAFNKFINLLNIIFNKLRDWFYEYKIGSTKADKEFIAHLEYFDFTDEWQTFKGTPIRAIAINKSGKQSKISTHTLFIGDKDQFSLPIIAITVPEKDLFDYDKGIFVAGVDYDNFAKKGKDVKGAKHHRPSNWKHDKNIYIKANLNLLNLSLSYDVQIKTHGDGSKANNLKSIRVKNKKKQLSSNSIFNTENTNHINFFNLRNAGQAAKNSYMKDAALQMVVKGLSIGTQDYAPKIIFINGEFNGLLNARERRDEYYLKNNFNLATPQVDLIKGKNALQVGDRIKWDEFDAYILEAKPDHTDFKEKIESFINLKSWYDYYSTEIYYGNIDWPSKNMAYWRSKNNTQHNTWSWLLFDLDAAFTNYGYGYNANFNGLEHITAEGKKDYPNPDWATRPVYKLLKNNEIKNYFITRFSDLINTTFIPKRVETIIREMEAGIEKEMPRHIERWQAPKSMQHWRNSINNMIEFAEKRPAIQRQHLQEFFELDDLYTAKVDVSNKAAGTVKLNTLHLGLTDDELEKPVAASARATHMTDVLAFPWQGEYFQNMPLTLEAVAKKGYQFSHWEIQGAEIQNSTNAKIELLPTQNVSVKAVFK